jgi:hypothetical protein
LGGVAAADQFEQQEDRADRQRQHRPQQRADETRLSTAPQQNPGQGLQTAIASGSSASDEAANWITVPVRRSNCGQ